MNTLIQQFYLANGGEQPFKEVIFLNETPLSWEDVSKRVPHLPRGWYELSRISPQDRIEFTREFWLDRFPYHPAAHPLLFEFFEGLDDIGVVLTSSKEDPQMMAELLYSNRDNSCFFRGKIPAKNEEIESVISELRTPFPRDYLSFARIHNGFGKLSEMGILSIEDVPEAKRRVMDFLIQAPERVKSGDVVVDPGSLIPFYEEFGLGSFQCFYSDWYPGSEMGNVYLSGIDSLISDVSDRKMWPENLAFPTFMDWFVNYLQGLNFSP